MNIRQVQILAKANIFPDVICLQMNLEANENLKILHVLWQFMIH
jgi:hypothetical protein